MTQYVTIKCHVQICLLWLPIAFSKLRMSFCLHDISNIQSEEDWEYNHCLFDRETISHIRESHDSWSTRDFFRNPRLALKGTNCRLLVVAETARWQRITIESWENGSVDDFKLQTSMHSHIPYIYNWMLNGMKTENSVWWSVDSGISQQSTTNPTILCILYAVRMICFCRTVLSNFTANFKPAQRSRGCFTWSNNGEEFLRPEMNLGSELNFGSVISLSCSFLLFAFPLQKNFCWDVLI